MNDIKDKIIAMIDNAIGGDVLADEDGGFISVMGKSTRIIQQDIPAAFEAYTLVSHFLGKLPTHSAALDHGLPCIPISPAILHDSTTNRVTALLPVHPGELDVIAYWLTDSVRSDEVKKMAGVLALAFSIENHAGKDLLLPEWFAAFYVDSKAEHCIPILALRSILTDQRLGGDWVSSALERMRMFSLPCDQAIKSTKMSTM